MDLVALFVGFILLIKGDFRFGQRYVPKRKGRLAGLVLMLPAMLSFCFGAAISVNELNRIGIENFAELTREEQMTLVQNAAIAYGSALSLIGIIVLGLSVAVALYLILSSPIGAPVPQMQPMAYSGPAGSIAQVMTPEEAARYLRVSESDVRALIDEGRLAAAKIGGDYRIARRALDDFLSETRAARPPRSDDPFADV